MLMILLKMLSLIFFFMICIIIPMTIRFSFIFFFCSYKIANSSCEPTLIRFQTSFSISMTFVRSNYLSQFAKLISFFW